MDQERVDSISERMAQRERIMQALYDNGYPCLWQVDGPPMHEYGSKPSKTEIRAYSIRGDVVLFHMTTNGSLYVYSGCEECGHTWDDVIAFIEGPATVSA